MQSESSIALCSLCRRPVTPDEGFSLSARLCDQCKSMIDAIKPAESKTTAKETVAAVAKDHGSPLEESRPLKPAQRIHKPDLPADRPAPFAFDWADADHVPMLVASQGTNSRWRGWFLVALLILAVSGAVAYSQIDRIQRLLAGGDRPDPAPAGVKADAPIVSPNSTAASAAAPVDPNAKQQPPQNDPTTSAAQLGSSTQAGRDLFSLQAASFPREAAAQQFSERLVRAGVPAYIIAADIPRRGRWYRVRAGKFATQEEAHRHSVEWQQRARAAGVAIQLVTCAFEQP